MKNVTLVRGHARFTAPRRIAVDDRVLEAPQVFLNVGGRDRVGLQIPAETGGRFPKASVV